MNMILPGIVSTESGGHTEADTRLPVGPEVSISSIEDIISEAQAGRPYILIETGNRESEGNLVVPACRATPMVINFMATHACGLICLAVTQDRAEKLSLRPMVNSNESRHGTTFAVSIEARTGVTTGISAFDRAHTIAVAMGQTSTADDIVMPGHVFPLVACEGGVLARAGHTEAAVDISRLAGLEPAGVICGIMNEDGTMGRLPDLRKFAARHGLKIGMIADLIAHRMRSEGSVRRTYEGAFNCRYGSGFHIHTYRDLLDDREYVALVRGRIDSTTTALVCICQVDWVPDLLGGHGVDCVAAVLAQLGKHQGPAVGVFIQGMSKFSEAGKPMGDVGCETHDSQRNYGIGAQVLKDLGVKRMMLVTRNGTKVNGFGGFGLTVEGVVGVEAFDAKAL